MRDLTCASGRTHDRPQEDLDADGSVGQAVTVGNKLRTVVVGYGPHQTQIQASIRSRASSIRAGGLRSAIKNKVRALLIPSVRFVAGFALR